ERLGSDRAEHRRVNAGRRGDGEPGEKSTGAEKGGEIASPAEPDEKDDEPCERDRRKKPSQRASGERAKKAPVDAGRGDRHEQPQQRGRAVETQGGRAAARLHGPFRLPSEVRAAVSGQSGEREESDAHGRPSA